MKFPLLLLLMVSPVFGQTISSVVNGLSYDDRLNPGCLGSIFGTNLGNSTTIPVTIGGKAAAVTFASQSQFNFVVPVDAPLGPTTLQLGQAVPVNITLVAYAPAIGTSNNQPSGPITATHANGALVTAANPALPSESIVAYGSSSIQNGQCSVSGTGSSVAYSPNMMVLTLNLTFTAGFGGNRVLYAAGRNTADGNNTGWQPVGTWTVQ